MMKSSSRRAMLAVGVTLVVYALAVVPHHGELWPFSIYPMFARAGRPWAKALVIEVETNKQVGWGPWTLDSLPGRVYPTHVADVSALDLSQTLQLTTSWTDERIGMLRRLFKAALSSGRTLLIARADGRLTGDAEVVLSGVLLLGPDGSELNPQLGAAP